MHPQEQKPEYFAAIYYHELPKLMEKLAFESGRYFGAPIFSPSGVCGRGNAWSWAEHTVSPHHPSPAVTLASRRTQLSSRLY